MPDFPETVEKIEIRNGKYITVTIKDGDSIICHGKKRTVRLGGIYCPKPYIPIINQNGDIVLVKLNEIQTRKMENDSQD